MFTAFLRAAVAIALAVLVAWGAYTRAGLLLASALVALFCFGAMAFARISAARRKGDIVHDPAISTLVFPPESKFQSSVMQRR